MAPGELDYYDGIDTFDMEQEEILFPTPYDDYFDGPSGYDDFDDDYYEGRIEDEW